MRYVEYIYNLHSNVCLYVYVEMNQLIRAKEANIKQINAMFAKDIRSIDQLIAENQQTPQQQQQSSGVIVPLNRIQNMANQSSATTSTNNSIGTKQLSNEQILQLLQQSINYELNNQPHSNSTGKSINVHYTNYFDSVFFCICSPQQEWRCII